MSCFKLFEQTWVTQMLTVAPLASGQANIIYHSPVRPRGTTSTRRASSPRGRGMGRVRPNSGSPASSRPNTSPDSARGWTRTTPRRTSSGTRKPRNGHTGRTSAIPLQNQFLRPGHSPRPSYGGHRAGHASGCSRFTRYIQDTCGIARVGAQGQRIERVPLMFARFEHSSSRAGDAQLHVHCVCPNITMHHRPQGKKPHTTAIDPTGFTTT